MSWGESMLWLVAPYVTLVVFVGGLIWRYKYDKFGWTTRSSQLYESPLLRVASPLFHYGLIFVIVGHVTGLLIPVSWTDAIGVSNEAYHMNALIWGGVAGLATVVALALLIYRRRTNGPVFLATTTNDKAMYAVLAAALVAGVVTTVAGFVPSEVSYRTTVAPWFRGIFVLQPDTNAMGQASGLYKVHTVIGMVLFVLFPFSRLVHALSAPITYLFRPYIVYRTRSR
ncbi:MAG: respiratory nitrate reductase subunit gamma [Nonomuraea sp.]|nr:respiratory nitrate reductase subunit gamma [Nonomuraea sp.]NUP62514.1 respiratory nitrate reductase subunit gamma [Nonomuraea sp.]NUP78177.1 respiratory nitrate reductase subunit gamma [Nonomuraea sp.]NUT43717.1 respiratory nitrate reductase subunit gamma [Thermoactinospora sp.]